MAARTSCLDARASMLAPCEQTNVILRAPPAPPCPTSAHGRALLANKGATLAAPLARRASMLDTHACRRSLAPPRPRSRTNGRLSRTPRAAGPLRRPCRYCQHRHLHRPRSQSARLLHLVTKLIAQGRLRASPRDLLPSHARRSFGALRRLRLYAARVARLCRARALSAARQARLGQHASRPCLRCLTHVFVDCFADDAVRELF